MDRLDSIHSFVRVVETGSFSAVARERQTTQPTISKQIAALEKYLDVQLLTRSTRQLQLTPEGERFFEHCQLLLDVAAQAEASVGGRQNPSGMLRVSCPVAFGQHMVMPFVKNFLDCYKDIHLDLHLSDSFVDFVEQNMDLALRIGQLNDPLLIAHRIGMTHRVTVASSSYFHERPIPQTPQELVAHNCIVYTHLTTGNEWHFQLPNGGTTTVIVQGNLQVDNSCAIREAVLSGLGIAVCPVWLFGDLIHSDHLSFILTDYQPTPLPIHLVYRRGRFISAKVRCFLEYFTDKFHFHPWISDLCPQPFQ